MKKTHIQQKSHRILWDFARSSENLTGFNEILLEPVKISSDLREISLESRKLSLESGFLYPILKNLHRNLEILAKIWKFWPESRNLSVDSGFSGGKPKPTRWNQFLEMKTCRWPTRVIRLTSFKLDPVGSSNGSGIRINLDSLNYICTATKSTHMLRT